MGVEARARRNGHDFLYRERSGERANSLTPADYVGDWLAAEKAITGVELRDPTADIDVVSFCFGVPPQQYLVEDIDRSLIRRAMWALLPEAVLTNRQSGVHSADWYEKLDRRRDWLAEQLTELSASPLTRRAIDFPARAGNQELAGSRRAHVRGGGRISARAAASLCGRAFPELVRVN